MSDRADRPPEGPGSGGGGRDRGIVFVGFMGAGKTTAARSLDPGALDTDELIEAREGRSIAEIFSRVGEAGFREIEEAVVLEALDSASSPTTALGGGAVESEAVREALADRVVVWLDVGAEAAWERTTTAGEAGVRPLADDRGRFLELHERRRGLYREVADAVFTEVGIGAVGRARPSLDALTRLPAGTKMLWAGCGEDEYPVFVGPGLLGDGGFAPAVGGPGSESKGDRKRRPWPASGRPFLITDESVWQALGMAAEPLGRCRAKVIAPGETSKTLATVEAVLSEMASAGWTRADHVVALGGGVVGDLAGFCAHTYQRGVPVVQVPTTVVGQVDSAYGGKTGVDLPEAKNYAGAYHMPAAVIADTETLTTLPAEETAAGFVEVVKTGLLAGGELWDQVQALRPAPDALSRRTDLIFGCARFKCDVVAADERDSGLRQILNLGHTVGHAIETAGGYGTYRHGEAVAIGLMAALRLSGADELRQSVGELLRAWNLPTEIEGPRGARLDVDLILEAVRRDKKRVGDEVPFVLIEHPGSPQFGQTVGSNELRDAVEELFKR